jgi:hypothetical protein
LIQAASRGRGLRLEREGRIDSNPALSPKFPDDISYRAARFQLCSAKLSNPPGFIFEGSNLGWGHRDRVTTRFVENSQ